MLNAAAKWAIKCRATPEEGVPAFFIVKKAIDSKSGRSGVFTNLGADMAGTFLARGVIERAKAGG